MGTSEMTSSSRTMRWLIPAAAAVIGVGYLIAGLVGDNVEFGVFGLGLMLAIGLAFVVLGRRSETVGGLLDRRDERINTIDRDATLFAGALTLLAVIVMFMVEIARGQGDTGVERAKVRRREMNLGPLRDDPAHRQSG